jgi:hypothetical protein
MIPFVILIVLALASAGTAWLSSRSPAVHVGPEGVVIVNALDLAPASTTASGGTIDGISCHSEAKEVVKFHIHAHVVIYVNGQQRRLPAGIGITKPMLVQRSSAGTFLDVGLYDCLYWIHTHVNDGIVHIEAPAHGVFTLGQFFDIWRQPLGPQRAGPASGPVVVFENGKLLTGNPRDTILRAHSDIQIDVGNPVVPFQPFTYQVTGSCGQGTNSCSTPTTQG